MTVGARHLERIERTGPDVEELKELDRAEVDPPRSLKVEKALETKSVQP